MFNRYKFEEEYGFAFGTRANVTKYIDPQNNEFELDFETLNHSEEDVRFSISTMAFLFFGKYMHMEIWDRETSTLLYEFNRSISMFVTLDGKDPLADLPTGDKRIPRIARTTGLKPNHKYRLKVWRNGGPKAANPIGLGYYATDQNEVSYEGATVEVPAIPGDEFPLETVKMVFGGISFTCIPD